METPTPLRFRSAGEWGSWLRHNGRTEREVWILIMKKHSKEEGMDLGTAVEEAICHGWIDGKLRRFDRDSFMLRFTPRRPDSVWSKINRDTAARLIKDGRMTAAGLATVDAARKSGWWSGPATNQANTEVPADLKKALLAQGPAWDNFERLSSSHRNQYIFWVNGAKLSRTREDRIAKVVARAAKGGRWDP